MYKITKEEPQAASIYCNRKKQNMGEHKFPDTTKTENMLQRAIILEKKKILGAGAGKDERNTYAHRMKQ